MTKALVKAGEASVEIIAITKLKHGLLWDLANKLGGQRALAKALGVSAPTVSCWIGLRSAFGVGLKGRRSRLRPEKLEQIALKLCELTGRHIKDIFPDFLVECLPSLCPVNQRRRRVKVSELNALRFHAERTAERLSWTADDSDRKLDNEDLAESLKQVLKTLSYREREILKLRYGLGGNGYTYTQAEVGKLFNCSKQRVRQIEAKAICKMQQPKRQEQLAAFVEAGANDQKPI